MIDFILAKFEGPENQDHCSSSMSLAGWIKHRFISETGQKLVRGLFKFGLKQCIYHLWLK